MMFIYVLCDVNKIDKKKYKKSTIQLLYARVSQ
jgi:hypothetical protein